MTRRKHAKHATQVARLERRRAEAIAAFVAQTLDAALAFVSAHAQVIARQPAWRWHGSALRPTSPPPPGLGRTDWEELANIAGRVDDEHGLRGSLRRLESRGLIEETSDARGYVATDDGRAAWIAGAVQFLKSHEWDVLEKLADKAVPSRRVPGALRYLGRVGLATVARSYGIAVGTITSAGRAALVAGGR